MSKFTMNKHFLVSRLIKKNRQGEISKRKREQLDEVVTGEFYQHGPEGRSETKGELWKAWPEARGRDGNPPP